MRTPVRGFTLPEVLITIILISILFLLGVIFSSGLRHTRKQRTFEIAIGLAQQAVEALRAAPFELIDDADAPGHSVEEDLNTANGGTDLYEPVFISNNVRYERKVEVENVPPANDVKGATPVGLKAVRVTVKWKGPEDDAPEPFVITTTIANLN
ncbi:MAG: hypothetical protein OZSIB_2777 [Candidatus Ozemobacter sibiricus]|uniref:Prepilin-type N-terminal cleavage/methylation domain-containing protein n=1 Tax=Candidatus Ozemobacter sibiricus TaxID=2268124 RepID=A0A367ZT57_9BACT|nr:MAG: hypothetical protein OZSIB_2777 [Candidatus Ozemobacter sibiricus]